MDQSMDMGDTPTSFSSSASGSEDPPRLATRSLLPSPASPPMPPLAGVLRVNREGAGEEGEGEERGEGERRMRAKVPGSSRALEKAVGEVVGLGLLRQ